MHTSNSQEAVIAPCWRRPLEATPNGISPADVTVTSPRRRHDPSHHWRRAGMNEVQQARWPFATLSAVQTHGFALQWPCKLNGEVIVPITPPARLRAELQATLKGTRGSNATHFSEWTRQAFVLGEGQGQGKVMPLCAYLCGRRLPFNNKPIVSEVSRERTSLAGANAHERHDLPRAHNQCKPVGFSLMIASSLSQLCWRRCGKPRGKSRSLSSPPGLRLGDLPPDLAGA